jgi:hypothetical protein
MSSLSCSLASIPDPFALLVSRTGRLAPVSSATFTVRPTQVSVFLILFLSAVKRTKVDPPDIQATRQIPHPRPPPDRPGPHASYRPLPSAPARKRQGHALAYEMVCEPSEARRRDVRPRMGLPLSPCAHSARHGSPSPGRASQGSRPQSPSPSCRGESSSRLELYL